MGCSPSLIRPDNHGKQPLACSNVIIEAKNHKFQDGFTSPDNENNNDTSYGHKLHNDNNSAVVSELNNQNMNLSKMQNGDSTEETDSAKILPVITNEERQMSSSQSPLNVRLLRRHYNKSVTHSDSMHNERKSVLKSSTNGIHPSDHMLANRPKTVTFVDSVTVITVF